ASPAVVEDSSRDPARTMSTTPTLRLEGMGASRRVTPLGRRVTVGVAPAEVMGDKCDGSTARGSGGRPERADRVADRTDVRLGWTPHDRLRRLPPARGRHRAGPGRRRPRRAAPSPRPRRSDRPRGADRGPAGAPRTLAGRAPPAARRGAPRPGGGASLLPPGRRRGAGARGARW